MADEFFDFLGRMMARYTLIPLRYNFYECTLQFKLLASLQIRTIRLVYLFELNGRRYSSDYIS